MKKALFTLLSVCSVSLSMAQNTSNTTEDLLGMIEQTPQQEKVTNAFKSPRVINNHSMEMLQKGSLDFRILHRFGYLSGGLSSFFGLDQAAMRLGFDYAPLTNLTVGVGRSTLQKEVDGYIKYRPFQQSVGGKTNMPVSVVWVSGMMVNGEAYPFAGSSIDNSFSNRMSFYHSVIVGRKINSKWTVQLTPMWLHRNVVTFSEESNDMFALGFGGRYKVSQRVAVLWDYTFLFNRYPDTKFSYPLSLGVDIDTGGHIFQLFVTNSTGMNEKAFLSSSNSAWLSGDIMFGFNISRVFQVGKGR